MQISAHRSVQNLVIALKAKILESPYAALVSLRQTTVTGVEVVISKFGTSTIRFEATHDNDASCELKLVDSSISFLHRKYIPDVYAWIAEATKDL